MFDESEYILIKTDPKYVISYANQTFQHLINTPEDQLIGQNLELVWRPNIPASMQRFASQQMKQSGFHNGFADYHFSAQSKTTQWIFFDFGKRYSPSGEWLGFEYIGYCPSSRGVGHFSQLFSELSEIEDGTTEGLEKSQEHLQHNIESTGMSYEELVCVLQDL